MVALCLCSQFKNHDAEISTSVIKNFPVTSYTFLCIKRQINNQRIICYHKKSCQSNCKWLLFFFCCKRQNAILVYPGFRATMQRHQMGISRIWNKELSASYGVPRLDGFTLYQWLTDRVAKSGKNVREFFFKSRSGKSGNFEENSAHNIIAFDVIWNSQIVNEYLNIIIGFVCFSVQNLLLRD